MSIKSKTIIQTEFGPFEVRYHNVNNKGYISFLRGDISQNTPIVRLQSACVFGEAFHSLHCDCVAQLTGALRTIATCGTGVVVYSYDEGKGVGLEQKINLMEAERTTSCTSEEAYTLLGLADMRDYKAEMQILAELGISKTIHLITNNEGRRKVFEDNNYDLKK